ncbi:MAG: rRNA pseudouridine synthase [Lachnospiraceae bacterium]|nr:rRNA pseudouridine synthase [Lachnospiraceae bacterium]
MKKLRLDKYLSDVLPYSRAEVKKIITKESVTVNGVIETDCGYKLDPSTDKILCDGEETVYEPFRYYVLNKPAGCVTALSDDRFPTVMDYLKDINTKDLSPVGRLDKDTEGLLLITNDGKLSHDLLSPKKHVKKTYLALVDRILSAKEEEMIETGIDIGDDKPCLPAVIEHLPSLDKDGLFAYSLTITEGRYHQVKRMFEAVGSNVKKLTRTSFAALTLDDSLEKGSFKKISLNDILG